MLTNPDEGSVKGKGAETMLPRRGDPFRAGAPAGSAAPVPPPAAPRGVDLSGTPDLTADDLAKLFPDAPSPNALAAENAAAPDEAFEATMAPYATLPAEPAAPAAPPGAAPPAPQGRQTGNNMYDPDIQWLGLQINPDEIGIKTTEFVRPDAVQADTGLVAFLVTDERLKQRWKEIDDLEAVVTTAPKISLKVAQEMLDRLATARNLLLGARDQIEDAERQIGEARYIYERARRSKWFEQPSIIFGFQLIMMLIMVGGFIWMLGAVDVLVAVDGNLRRLGPAFDTLSVAVLWASILWGGLGGVTGAFWNLWRHVAEKKDFDASFSVWYYTYPLLGMMLGAFVYVVVLSGVLSFLQETPLFLFILAWAVGFQQNLIFKLVNNVLKRFGPDDAGDTPQTAA
ncbi:MAG: hypothetical protein JNK29_11305 [Anaerolineales bacterium]|nr:hypothetical protein [Anaerolineales bacterium]